MQKAIDDHLPKLDGWKRKNGARTVLILEVTDIQLTNQGTVADAYIPLVVARKDAPDETYVVFSCMTPWHAWPILIDGKTYFDLAKAHTADVGWQIDQASLAPLTKR
jgi:hypothetical protein